MSKPVVEVQIRAVATTSGGDGLAVFLGNEGKAFVIFVDASVGAAIAMFMQGTKKERPLTHDLVADILRALGTKIERVIVNDFKSDTYFARLVLSVENELKQKKIIEIDARPSDCIAMATAQHAPIYVSLDVWNEVEDMTGALRELQERAPHTEESGEEENSADEVFCAAEVRVLQGVLSAGSTQFASSALLRRTCLSQTEQSGKSAPLGAKTGEPKLLQRLAK